MEKMEGMMPEEVLKKLEGVSFEDVKKMPILQALDLEDKILDYHEKIKDDMKLRKLLADSLSNFIKKYWAGKNIKKYHAKALNEEEHNWAKAWLQANRSQKNEPTHYMNNFGMNFYFKDMEDNTLLQVVSAKDFEALKLDEETIAHLSIHGLSQSVRRNFFRELQQNPELEGKIGEIMQKENKYEMVETLMDVFDRLVEEQKYLPEILKEGGSREV